MKNMLIASTIALMFSTPALAEKTRISPDIHDHYTTVIEKQPYLDKKCYEVQIEKKPPMNTEGAIVGGIIGGVIGNQIGKGGGKDAATGVGAITGAIIGGNSGKPEYITRQRCEFVEKYNEVEKTVYSHSTITFYHNGQKYTLKFHK